MKCGRVLRILSENRERHPEVHWNKMKSIRNVVIHEHFRIDELVLWDTVTQDLPSLVPMVRKILEDDEI